MVFTRYLLKLTLLSALLLGLACDRPKKSQGGGVVDSGGGGDFIYNTEEEVLRAIDQVWSESTKLDPFYNPALIAESLLKNKPRLSLEERIAKDVLAKVLSSGPPEFKSTGRSENTNYLRHKRPRLELTGYCRGPHDHKYLASVTKLDRSGEMCLSVYGLMRTPSASLQFDLYGLFAHEAAHLNGYGEVEARAFQRFILKNIMIILQLTGDNSRHWLLGDIRRDYINHWVYLVRYDRIDEEYVRNVARVAEKIKFIKFVIPNELHRGVAEPKFRSTYTDRATSLGIEVFDFGVELLEDLRAGKTEITARHLRRVQGFALAMLELEKLLTKYMFSDSFRPRQAGGNIRTQAELNNEISRIRYATGPELLTQPEKRVRLLCRPSKKTPTSLAEELEALAQSDEPKPCEGTEEGARYPIEFEREEYEIEN